MSDLADPRYRIDVQGHNPPSKSRFFLVESILEVSGLVPEFEARIDSNYGRPRSHSVYGWLHSATTNALRRHHQAHVAEIARTTNSYLPWQLHRLGIRNWDPEHSYKRTSRMGVKIRDVCDGEVLVAGTGDLERITAQEFLTRIIRASLFDLQEKSASRAIDATPITTWPYVRKARIKDIPGPSHEMFEPDQDGRPTKTTKGYPIVAWGDDGFPYYTKDYDARSGHLSATNGRHSGTHTGYDYHAVTQVPDVLWSNGVDKVTFGPEVPAVVTGGSLVPANSHAASSIIPVVIEESASEEIIEVAMDRGYNQLTLDTWSIPLAAAGITPLFRPKEGPEGAPYQRAHKSSSSSYAILIEGALFSSLTPPELLGPLPMPPEHSSEAKLEAYEREFNRRALWRWHRIAAPDEDGFTRWECPFHHGSLRSRSLPFTMKNPRSSPLVELPKGTKCCDGTITVSAEEMALWQRLLAGTTAWRISFGRRQQAERTFSGLKGGFVDIDRKFLRVYGLTRMTIMLAFTTAGYNREVLRSFGTKRDAPPSPKARRGRREGTLAQLLADSKVETAPDPPAP